MERLASDPHYFANPDKTLFQDIRRYFPITVQAQVAWAVQPRRRGRGRVRRGADRVGRVRGRRRPLPCDDAQGQAVPAHAAAGARLLPVAPASRVDIEDRRVAPVPRAVRWRTAVSARLGRVDVHDTDKLIRQLSLVAFLMAERRPLTARDIKSNVEGYQEMTRRGVRAPLLLRPRRAGRLGVPLESQRDEFTGEELYTLRSEQYFLPPLELDDDELAALQTCLYLLEGTLRVRRAAPARAPEPRARPLAAAGSTTARRRPRCASRCATPTTRPSCRAGSASSRARSRSSARSASATGRSPATTSASARSTRTRCCPRTARGT